MKKILLFTFLFIFLCIPVFSYEELKPGVLILLNKTLYDGQKLEVDGSILSIQIGSSYQVMLDHKNTTFILQPYKCVTKDPYQYCMRNVSVDAYDNLFAETEIYYRIGILDINRTIGYPTGYVGQLVNVETVLTNNGYQDISNIRFVDAFPDSVRIWASPKLTKYVSSVFWNGTLNRGNSITLSYTFYAKNSTSFEQQANATFFNGYTLGSANSSLQECAYNYSLAVLLPNATLVVGEEAPLNMVIDNPYREDMDINLNLTLPFGVQVASAPGFFMDGNDLTLAEGLTPGQQKNRTLRFKALKTGSYNVTTFIDLLYVAGVSVTEGSFLNSFTVILEPLSVVTDLDTTETVKEETTKSINMELTNKNAFASFVNITVTAFLGNQTLYAADLPNLAPSTAASSSFNIDILSTNDEITEPLNLSFSYATSYGERFTKNLSFVMIIKPDNGIDIIKNFSNLSFSANQTLSVSVAVRNNRNILLEKVYVQESIPPELHLLTGLTKKSVPLDAGELVDVYNYTLVMPDLDYDQDFIIETAALNEINDHLTSYTLQQIISVKGKYGKKDPALPPENITPSSFNASSLVNSSASIPLKNATLYVNQTMPFNQTAKSNQTNEGNQTTNKTGAPSQKARSMILPIVIAVIIALLVISFIFKKKFFKSPKQKSNSPQQPSQSTPQTPPEQQTPKQ